MAEQIADGMTSRREWRVFVLDREGREVSSNRNATCAGTADTLARVAHRIYPGCTIEIEELEHITRRVERRVVPRGEA